MGTFFPNNDANTPYAMLECTDGGTCTNAITGGHPNIHFKAEVDKGTVDRTYDITFWYMFDIPGSTDSWTWKGRCFFKLLINNIKLYGDVYRTHDKQNFGCVGTNVDALTYVQEGPLKYTYVALDAVVPCDKGAPMRGWYKINSTPLTFSCDDAGKIYINEIQIDSTRTNGDNKAYSNNPDSVTNKAGLAHGIDVNYTRAILSNWDLKVEQSDIAWASKPTISNLRNDKPYKYDMNGTQNTKNNVSEYIDGIHVKCDIDNGGAAITKAEYSLNGGTWIAASGTGDTIDIRNLTAGTKYSIKVKYTNSVGSTESGPIEIYTLHKSPVLTLVKNNADCTMTKLVFNWTSDKPLYYLEYDRGDGKKYKVPITAGSTSGTINIGLEPGSTITIKAKGRATEAYHYRWSGEPSANGTTLSPPSISSSDDIIFGTPFNVNISPSGVTTNITLTLNGNNITARCVRSTADSSITITPTQAEWDNIYKAFSKSSNVSNGILESETTLTIEQADTNGTITNIEKTYRSSVNPKPITLTGIAKTAHLGVNNSSRRAQIWYGDSTGRARRGVVWTGISGTAKRSI